MLWKIPKIPDDSNILVVFWGTWARANDNSGEEGEERQKFRDGESIVFDDINGAVGYGLFAEGSKAGGCIPIRAINVEATLTCK